MKAFAILLVLFLSALAADAFSQPPAFGPALSLPAQKAPLAITAADFNGDGFQDIAVANTASATISIFLGAGNGKFSSAATVSLPSTCPAAYLTNGDFTGAASPDLLTVCALGGIVVLPNTGAGTFGTPLSTSLPGPGWIGNLLLGSIHPAIADFNGDGHLDIAVPTFDISTTSAGWYLLLGQGNGSFQAPAPLPFSSFVPLSLAAGDFNGDGKPDLVAGVADSSGSPSLEFAAGNGDGTFQSPTSIGLPTTIGSLILVADVNGDGNLDVVFAGSSLVTNVLSLLSPSFTGESAVTVFLGDGKGGFQKSFNATESSYGSGAALADVTLDGKLDIIQTMIQGNYLIGGTPTGAIEVRPGNGDGTFQDPITMGFLAATVPTDVAVADFNGDGRPDIAVSALPALGLSLGSINLTSDLDALLSSVLAQLPSGDADVLLNLKLYPANYNTFTDTNAASFATGSLANGSMVSAFGTGLAASTASATMLPLPTMLADVTIAVKDSSGATIDAPLFYVSPSQINYAIPAATAAGASTITITSGGSVFTATQQIVPVAPGVFSDNGLAAGFSVVNVNGVQKNTPLVQNGALVPVNVSGGQTYLELFGTGIRNHAKPVVAILGSTKVTAAYAGAQGVYVGEDQINIQLPASLQGAGKIAVSLLVDGETTNSVQVLIQ
jgi:uncharacterized protein (TIGR03437 family)